MRWMRKKQLDAVEIDEIFLDSRNIHGFNRENLEGALEKDIGKKRVIILYAAFGILWAAFFLRVSFLGVVRGEEFFLRAETNRLRVIFETLERGVIYDRRGELLVKNAFGAGGRQLRIYPRRGFFHALGYLSRGGNYSASAGNFSSGASGLEIFYENVLRGAPAKKIEEVGNTGEILDSGFIERGEAGKSIATSLDKDLQLELFNAIERTARERGFKGGAGVFMDAYTGEILAFASFPEIDPNIFYNNLPQEEFDKIAEDPKSPFLNRAVSGLYPPGSIVKPAIAAGALAEEIISPEKEILSTGYISLPNRYDPTRPNIFPDWKAHGLVDMRRALAVSSDVYFYEIGGGFEDQRGLGAANIKKYLKLFGFGEPTALDLPGEKSGYLPDETQKKNDRDWGMGDTYNLSIGQGDLLVTPIQMALYAAGLATGGRMPYPHLVQKIVDENKNIIETFSYPEKAKINLSPAIFKVIREGMLEAARTGTAAGLGVLPFEVAAKTGTAEIGDTDRVHSWLIGFAPYEKPKIAFAILMESGPRYNLVGATFVASEVLRWMADADFLSVLNRDTL